MAPKAREDVLRKKREAEKLRMEKIRNNPELWKLHQEKEKIKYQKKLAKKQVKLVADMTSREHRIEKKKWRARKKNQRKREAEASRCSNTDGTPTAKITDSLKSTPSYTKSARQLHLEMLAKKKRDCAKRKAENELAKLRRENAALRKRLEKQKKRALRANATMKTNSPRSKVRKLMKTGDMKVIRRQLLFGETLASSISQGYKQGGRVQKRTIQTMMKSQIGVLRKYCLINKLKCFTSRFFSRGSSFRKNATVRRLRNDVKDEVRKFFERDDVSRMCAGKKECVTYKKVKKQKRFLLGSLKDLHQKFCAQTTAYTIGYTIFCSLKPFWVLQPKVTDRETCVCKIHANIEHLVAALHSAGAIDKKKAKDLAAYICCDVNSVSCLQRSCSRCAASLIPYLEFDNAPLSYEKWVITKKEVTLPNKTKKTVSYTSKEKISSTVLDAVDSLEVELKNYMIHEGIAIHQFREVDSFKKRMQANEALIHCDFSENYATKYGQEVQSFHFGGSRRQITLHTCQVYFKKDAYSDVTSKSICSLSKSTDHGAPAVWAHLAPVLEFLRQNCPNIEVLHFLSDSPSTQYRNKTIFYLVATALKASLAVKTSTWNYCAAGHGKGAPDGIGGVLKRIADAAVAQGADVNDFESFVATLQAKTRNIMLCVVEEEDISAIAKMLPKSIPPYKGTMKVQQFVWSASSPNTLKMKSLSCLNCLTCDKFLLGTHAIKELYLEEEPHPPEILEIVTRREDDIIAEPATEAIVQEPSPSCSHSYQPKGEISDVILRPGTFVLAKFDSIQSPHEYYYVCCLGEKTEEGEFQVQGLRLFGKSASGKEFILNTNDECVIDKRDIMLVLPNPKLKVFKRKLIHVFPFTIDVREK